jgi:Mn2+/Fe2+ NRAMP family transporter
MLSTASTLFTAGSREIHTATDAARALEPLAGRAASLLWAPGLIGAGVLCVPILTGSAAYAVAEALGWRHGLDERPAHAKLFYGVIAASTLVGMAINFLGLDTMMALVWTAVINGLIAPPILVLVMLITNDRRILGSRVNGRLSNAIGWSTTLAMFMAAIALLVSFAQP